MVNLYKNSYRVIVRRAASRRFGLMTFEEKRESVDWFGLVDEFSSYEMGVSIFEVI